MITLQDFGIENPMFLRYAVYDKQYRYMLRKFYTIKDARNFKLLKQQVYGATYQHNDDQLRKFVIVELNPNQTIKREVQ